MNAQHPTVKLEPIHLLYDERMLLHRPVGWVEPEVFPEALDDIDDDYPMENPERLRVIYERLCNLGKRLLHKGIMPGAPSACFQQLTCNMATKEQILLAHSKSHYERLEEMQYYTDAELAALTHEVRHDLYYNRETFQAARLAAGGLLACVDAVCDPAATSKKSLALVRPPGHHACQSQEMGFCFIDSVVVAAKYALATKKATRIAILDWDIHDGNGTAEATLDDPNIFRIDLHRYNPKAGFYPYTGPPTETGTGEAKGLNLNMAWSQPGMRNQDYAAAFYELVLPLLSDYCPDLLIISCGLDAAMGDLLGGCELTPGFFHAMTRASLEAVGPQTPVVCALEGGYTMSVIPDCMEAVTLAMLHLPYSYHSAEEGAARYYYSSHVGARDSCCGGAAEEDTPWSADPLERSRRVLSKYYMRGRSAASMLLYSAVQDINLSIRIFKSIPRWKHLNLSKIEGGPPKPPTKNSSGGNSKRSCASTVTDDRPFQRPRIYLWYGTEDHHRSFRNSVW